LKKDIEALIRTKACSIYEKHYSDEPYIAQTDKKYDKEIIIHDISLILKTTLITPRRKRYLELKFPLSAKDTFGADSNIFFSPNFEDSLNYLSPSYALNLFKEKCAVNTNKYYAKEHLAHQRVYGIIPYFTLKELADLIKVFTTYLEDNTRSLIKTGWPEYNFTDSVWLFYQLAPNYPIEIPVYLNNFHRFKNPHHDPYFLFKKYFLHEINQFKKCKGKVTPLSKKLSHKEIGYIEEMRYKFLNLKISILNEINQHLFLETTDKDVWFQDCARMLFNSFSKKDLQIIEIIDKKYDKIKLFNHSLNGGLNSLIEIIIFLYEECKFEKMTLEKNAMDSTLEGSKLNHQGKFRSYYQLAQFTEDDYENKRFNKMKNKLNDELVKIEKEIIDNKQFISDTLERAKKECLNVHCVIKQKYYPFINSLIKCFENGESFEICMPFLNQYPAPTNKRITPLKLPSGTKWEHITIQFLDYDKVKIQAPDKFSKIVNFRKMGFENLKNGKPNMQWKLLYDLSRYRGDLSWTIATYRKKVDSHPLSTPKIKKQIQRLSSTLKEYFSINDAPFYDYVKIRAYKTKFFLLPDPLNIKTSRDVTRR